MILGLPVREERPERYEANKEINELIEVAWQESVESFEGYPEENIPVITFKRIQSAETNGYVRYGTKTLYEAGCAVFCFAQGLQQRGVTIGIQELAKEIANKGYYYPGRGTYHNLFDHYGLRRASSVDEIFDVLKSKKLVTFLVKNEGYPFSRSNEGSHFINIVGKSGPNFIVDDSNSKVSRVNVDIKTLLQVTRVAWIW